MKASSPAASADDHGRRWLICYDVADDGQRAAVSHVLGAYGQRVQFSVFVCWLTMRERRRLVRELAALRRPQSHAADIRIYPVWSAALGQPARASPAPDTYWMS